MDRLYAEKRVNYAAFDGKHCKNTVKKMFLKDFLYICLSSNVFKVWGDKGIGNIVKTDVLERFYGAKCVNYRVLKGNIAKTCKHTSKVTGFEGFCGKNADNGAKCRWTVFLGVVVAI